MNTIKVELAPASVILSHDNKSLYVINYDDGKPNTGSLSIVSTNTNKVVNTIKGLFGLFGSFAIALSKHGRYAYVTNFNK
jgi:DNA-binding beta-propeller fold protein YncE